MAESLGLGSGLPGFKSQLFPYRLFPALCLSFRICLKHAFKSVRPSLTEALHLHGDRGHCPPQRDVALSRATDAPAAGATGRGTGRPREGSGKVAADRWSLLGTLAALAQGLLHKSGKTTGGREGSAETRRLGGPAGRQRR